MAVIDHMPVAAAAGGPPARQRYQRGRAEKQIQPVIVEPYTKAQ
jgi:hypothetical protein